jgi:hypothetical protein
VETIKATTDGNGFAYLEVEPAKDYRVSVELEVPRDPGCSYKASGWVSSANPEIVITLDRKTCS